MPLSDTQALFKDTMLDHPDVVANPPVGLFEVFEEDGIALSERLKVYRNNIVGSLTDVMVASFPVIEKLVGKEFLEGMARSFVLAHPPAHGCLNFYGRGFAEFIAGFGPAASLPYLPDIARLEIAMNDSYYAVDDEALSAEALSAIAAEDLDRLILTLRHSVFLLQSDYPLTAIRAFADKPDGTLDIDQGGEALMINRPDLDTQITPLEMGEFAILQMLQNSIALGQAVEETLQKAPDFDFGAFLQKHLALETFAALDANRSA